MPETKLNAPPLPDFCQPQAVLLVVLLGLLLALLIALAGGVGSGFWLRLGLTALFVEGVVLAASLLLCTLRVWLSERSPVFAYLAIFVVIEGLVLAATGLAARMLPLDLAAAEFELGSIMLRNALIAAIAALVLLRFLSLHREWQRQVHAEATAQLAALQARIRPHFLFNALNTIASLIRTRPEQAENAVLDLSDLLRTGLADEAEHSLGEELDLVRGFLRIEGLRLGDRLGVDWQIDERAPLDTRLPALLIQPLIENAVVHGIARLADGGRLRVEVAREGRNRWRVMIENPLPPVSTPGAEGGHRIALDNVRKRMELAFGDQGRCRVDADDRQFRIELIGPIL